MSTNPDVTANIRAEMARAERRQVDLAEVLEMSQPQISARLNDAVPWRIAELQTLARYFSIPIARLVDAPIPATPQPVDADAAAAS